MYLSKTKIFGVTTVFYYLEIIIINKVNVPLKPEHVSFAIADSFFCFHMDFILHGDNKGTDPH